MNIEWRKFLSCFELYRIQYRDLGKMLQYRGNKFIWTVREFRFLSLKRNWMHRWVNFNIFQDNNFVLHFIVLGWIFNIPSSKVNVKLFINSLLLVLAFLFGIFYCGAQKFPSELSDGVFFWGLNLNNGWQLHENSYFCFTVCLPFLFPFFRSADSIFSILLRLLLLTPKQKTVSQKTVNIVKSTIEQLIFVKILNKEINAWGNFSFLLFFETLTTQMNNLQQSSTALRSDGFELILIKMKKCFSVYSPSLTSFVRGSQTWLSNDV